MLTIVYVVQTTRIILDTEARLCGLIFQADRSDRTANSFYVKAVLVFDCNASSIIYLGICAYRLFEILLADVAHFMAACPSSVFFNAFHQNLLHPLASPKRIAFSLGWNLL